MNRMFESWRINSLLLPNRFVRSATMDHFAENGMVTETELDLYRDLALGEVGLIVSHGLCPSPEGWVSPGQLCIDRDETIPSLAKLVDAVHKNGGKIAAQLMHGGWGYMREYAIASGGAGRLQASQPGRVGRERDATEADSAAAGNGRRRAGPTEPGARAGRGAEVCGGLAGTGIAGRHARDAATGLRTRPPVAGGARGEGR